MKHLALPSLLAVWTLVFMAVGPVLSQGEPALCGDSEACNYNPLSSPAETAECDYCSCPEVQVPTSYHFESDVPGYGLRVDLVADHDVDNPDLTSLAGMKTYRFYATVSSAEERVTAVFGSDEYGSLVMNAPGGFYHDPLGSLIGSGIQSQLFDVGFPELEYDSWVTIGVDSDPNLLGPGYSSITTIAADDENWIVLFEPGMGQPGASFSITSFVGGGWFTLPDSDNCIPDADNAVLIGQFTTPGDLDGVITFQALLDPAISGEPEDIRSSVAFNTSGLGEPTWTQPEDCPCEADVDADGICEPFDACADLSACNYDDPFNADCLYLDACGVCGGDGFPEGTGDCEGTPPDALGICGGSCTEDLDEDGVCDVIDPCVGELDDCGVCNGPGAVYECGCNDIPECDCDCDGNQLDALGVCGGSCTADLDGDGVCDDVDSCIGELDDCGICNGPGEIYDCGCSGIPAGDCDCDGNQLDALGVCGGDCAADLDGDGVCDDADPCVGTSDACGTCNGPGAIYDCGCSVIAAGDCDCNGNQLDALGNCGGDCTADADGDGVCDDTDPCVGTVDACGICNGPGETYDCGCSGIPSGDCECDRNQLDALGICGGTCTADLDGDGVCDDTDPCVGALDACGICNGPGEIYDCGCSGIPAGDCDCEGNQPDALGICGGECASDLDGDGVCDVDEVPGCTKPFACNYNALATDDDGECQVLDVVGDCGGTCTADLDGDGLCDDVDPCVGALDACGVCNGPGEIYDCGCNGVPDGDCDCEGNQPDALGLCGGDCAADLDEDGICDDEEIPGCVDPLACNFNPNATEQAGACFYEDAIGVCGGACPGDADEDGICDTEDTCFGSLDACGVCNGLGAIFSCGCVEILPGACDCDGNMPDAVGVCDGECEADDNGNGICDDLEDSLCGPGTTWNPVTGQCQGTGDGTCPGDFNSDGEITVSDLLNFLTLLGTSCPE